MALLFARLPLAKSAAVAVFIWGIVCILTTVCTDYRGFIAQRFVLGLVESAVSPAFVAITAMWYKPYEQAKRLGTYWLSPCSSLNQAVSRYLVFRDRCTLLLSGVVTI